jgi:hypothetical protein
VTRTAWIAGGMLVLAVLTACSGPAPAPAGSPTAIVTTTTASSSATTASATPAARPLGPAATVQAYFTAINRHQYRRAWRLGGRYTGISYAEFVSGFAGTAHDAVSILSVAGHVVTAQLRARQTDGSVKHYEGTYRVSHGVITGFNVAQVFPAAPAPPPSQATLAGGCHPTASTGNCYEPGEFCPHADADMTGVAGDGKTITCELVNGYYRWED